MAQPVPTPEVTSPLPADTAARIRTTAPRRTPPRLAALVLAAGVVGGAFSMTLPAGEAQAMRPSECWYKGWFVEDGIWYYGWFLESC
jgi:hypothetical protein